MVKYKLSCGNVLQVGPVSQSVSWNAGVQLVLAHAGDHMFDLSLTLVSYAIYRGSKY